jgi:Cd2+/Zn2+-exporting ATPase
MADTKVNPIKYRLTNLDCATCAANIESAVEKLSGVRYANVGFADASLHLDADDHAAVLAYISTIEPNVQVRAIDNPELEEGRRVGRSTWLLAGSLVLFLLGLGVATYWDQNWGTVLLGAAYLVSGHQVLLRAFNHIRAGNWFDENFLMSVSTLGAIAINELPEAVGVMLFYQVGEYLQERSVRRSRRMIGAMMAVQPDTARLLGENGAATLVDPETVSVGSTIQVHSGERVALDGVVMHGASQIDASMLTGESLPVSVKTGDKVFAGTINQGGVLDVRVTSLATESTAARMLDLVQNAASRKARTEQFITRFARVYSPIMVGLAAAVALLPPLLVPGASFQTWVYRALVLLVISCPCALVISIPLGYFGGIGGASRRGILVKGANYLDVLAEVRTVLFDKTGTLTKGKFEVIEIEPAAGVARLDVLRLAALAEQYSTHPMAEPIRRAYQHESGEQPSSGIEVLTEYQEMAGLGVKVSENRRMILAGNDAILHQEGIPHDTCDVPGTVVHIALNGEYQGYLVVADEIKPGAREAVSELHAAGVENVIMLSGDTYSTAAKVAAQIGLDDFQAGLSPGDKVAALERVLESNVKGKVAFVGDGINDAPALARADVGIAMGELGSDAAKESSDVVLMTDSVEKVAEAIWMGKRTRRIVWQNIGLALGIKAVFIALGIAGEATMWEAVFADVGVTVLAVLNASRVLR